MFGIYFRRRLTAIALIAAALFAAGLQFAPSSEGASRPIHYTVQPGDTLWQIATSRVHGDPRAAVDRIAQLNHIDAGMIQPGEVLLVPTAV